MSEEFAGEKTLPASPRKIERARERGQVAKSQDLSASMTLLFALIGLWLLGPGAFSRLLQIGERFLGEAHVIPVDRASMQPLAIQVFTLMLPVVMPLMLLILVGGVAVNIMQFGVLFSTEALTPKLQRLDPIAGFRRYVSIRSLVELIKSLSKLGIIGTVVWFTVRGRLDEILSLIHLSPRDAAAATWSMVLAIWWRIVFVMLVIGILDYAYQRWQHLRDLMMTPQEARQELKQLEGDPQIKQRVRSIQRQMAMQRMMTEVPEADVVITNPTTYAVAVRYAPDGMDAPKVVAKGARLVADRIRLLAVDFDVPIVERPELARLLYRTVEVGDFVPENLFRTVAEVLAYVYRIDRRAGKIEEREGAALPVG